MKDSARGERSSGNVVATPAPETSTQGQLGAALLALRARAPKAPLSKLYDRHRDKLEGR